MAVAALLAAWSMVGAVEAQAPGRAVIVGAVPPPLLERIEGQTADLDWQIGAAAGPEASGGLTFAAALSVAALEGARVVVWFDVERRDLTLYIADADQRRLFARHFTAASGPAILRDSATLETAALVIRSTLQALALGGEIGVAVTPQGSPEATQPAAGVELVANLGWALAWDGHSLPAQNGPTISVGAGVGVFTVRLSFVAGLRQELDDDVAQVQLARHVLRVSLTAAPVRRPGWMLELGASGGAAIYRRTTGETAPGYTATDDVRSVAGMVGPLARLSWLLGRSGTVGFSLAAGVDAVLPAPLLQYEQAGMFINRNDLWAFQPWTAAEIEIRAR